MKTTVTIVLLLGAFCACRAAEVKDAPATSSFSCGGRSAGYYADLESGCQKYHMCDASGRIYTYSCPNQTLFQQRVMICDHHFMVDCALSETHFGANLLIGQKDRHFVEHFQQASGHNQERGRSYPTNTREYYADPSTPVKHDLSSHLKVGSQIQSQSSNEIKQALSVKPPPSQAIAKKLLEEKESFTKAPVTNRYNTQFSTPSTGSIKPTSERSLQREFANNPFFRGLTPASSLIADKGEHDLLTFLSPHQRRDHAESSSRNVFHTTREEDTHSGTSTSTTSWTTLAPFFAPRGTSSFSVPPNVEVKTALRNTPSFSKYQDRRTSTFVTTEVPLTYDSKFVTPQGHSNHLQTETPKLRNNFAKVITNDENFTSQPSLTTQYEFLKTRERFNAYSSAATSKAPHELGVTPSPQTGKGSTYSTARGNEPLPTTYGNVGFTRPNVTYGDAGGLQITAGGFKFTAHNTTRVSDGGRVTSPPAATQVPGGHPVSNRAGTPTAFDVTRGSHGGVVLTGPVASHGSDKGRVPTGPGVTSLENHPTVHGEDEVDFNTVEVRIPDQRRMFFIPDSAAREAEVLNSNKETVLTISLPSGRHYGAMRFKGARGSEGRRADCPQCHPAFLLPGQCHPCVLIRR